MKNIIILIIVSFFPINVFANKNAGCLIVNKNKDILMSISTKNGKFHIPGGTNVAGESSIETAKRETFEELGVPAVVKNKYKEYANFILYWCVISDVKHNHIFEDEISGNSWVNIRNIKDEKLRFPEEYRTLYHEIQKMKTKDIEKYIYEK